MLAALLISITVPAHPMRPLLLYIHGFLSSPHSQKAQEVAAYIREQNLAVDFLAPELPNYPMASYRRLQAIVEAEAHRPVAVIGSSLGGFMATALAEANRLRAVLVNPAVAPAGLIAHYLGPNQNPYTGERFVLTEQHVEELRQLTVAQLQRPAWLRVLVQAGDETLDYRQAANYYAACSLCIEPGGNHRFEGFDKHLPDVFKFLELPGVEPGAA